MYHSMLFLNSRSSANLQLRSGKKQMSWVQRRKAAARSGSAAYHFNVCLGCSSNNSKLVLLMGALVCALD
jgi:hypothetical protein